MRRTATAVALVVASGGKEQHSSPPVFLCDLGPLSFSPAIVNWAPGAGSLGQACISELTVEGMRDRDMALAEGGGQGGRESGGGGNSSDGDILYKFRRRKNPGWPEH